MNAAIESKEGVENLPPWLEIVRRQVGSLRFGVVQIVVHDSEVTQIDKTERVRFDKPLKFKPTGNPEEKPKTK
jgi:hypothetical protein